MSGGFSDAALDALLEPEVCRLGEICIVITGAGTYSLSHRDDVGRDDLVRHDDAEAAEEIARYDDAGNYRPLKTAPNLRHGWRLEVEDRAALVLALDGFYPARLATFSAWKAGDLRATALRDTLERQTGMYRAAAKITDGETNALVGSFCRSDGGCLRTILWKRDRAGTEPSSRLPAEKYDPAHDQTGRQERTFPLLCQEACNLLVAEARKVVKSTAVT